MVTAFLTTIAGIATYPLAQTGDALIKIADSALSSSTNGRNAFTSATIKTTRFEINLRPIRIVTISNDRLIQGFPS